MEQGRLIDAAPRAKMPATEEKMRAQAEPLFSTALPESEWTEFRASGYSQSVSGVIYRTGTPATNGMPLGGVDTGCIDLDTSAMWGYCTLFDSHVPRRGPINRPFLGLATAGKTWVLCDPTQVKRYQTTDSYQPTEPYPTSVLLTGVETAKEIHYFGHYPVADLEFETTAPVGVSLRAWSPFLPGDVETSLLPGIVFEVRLRNTSKEEQRGAIAFSFPGPSDGETSRSRMTRESIHGELEAVLVQTASLWETPIRAPHASYVLGVIGSDNPRFGGALDADGGAWSRIGVELPKVHARTAGSSAAVDFVLAPGAGQTVRFLLTWHSPRFKAGGTPAAATGNVFTHMYALHWRSARAAALLLARRHEEILRRVIAWQEAIYGDESLPPWLRDSLINNLHLITETGMWVAAEPPLPSWVRPEDGLFGMNECPRGCPQIECIPCSFYGNIPVVYFFRQLALSTLRGYKGYQYPEGTPPWVFGGITGQTPPIDFANPTRGYQVTLNGLCYAAMVDRYALCWGGDDFIREFYQSVKRTTTFTVNLRPEYEVGDRIISMPTGNEGTEWFEAPEPGWYGLVSHVGGLHIAECRIAERLAEEAGDKAWAARCREWIDAGTNSMESKMWAGACYLNCWEPETGARSDLVFGYQLDGEWVADFHGLPGVFRPDRVETTLETIKRCNVALSATGAVNYALPNGAPAPVGGYGTYSYFPPEVLMLAMTYMYKGQRAFGLDLARRCWENIVCKWRYTWDMPNIMRGDKDTGESTYGHDYYQDMMLWALPAALAEEPMNGPLKSGGLVERVLRAANSPSTAPSLEKRDGELTD